MKNVSSPFCFPAASRVKSGNTPFKYTLRIVIDKQTIAQVDQLLTEAIAETRSVSHQLVPKVLQEFGLQAAINDICRRLKGSGIDFSCHSISQRFDPGLELAIYRICQELVNNIVKHSQATRARLKITRNKDWIYIEAQDNGQGVESISTGTDIG